MDGTTDKVDLIKDDELKLFLERDYEEKLEANLAETDVGKRINALQKMGIKVSLKHIVDRYIEINGRKFDEVGNILVDMSSVDLIYSKTLDSISQEMGFDISNFHIDRSNNIDEVRRRANQYKEQESIKEKVEAVDRILRDIKGNKPDEKIILKTSDMIRLLNVLKRDGMTSEELKEVEKSANENNKLIVKNNLTTRTEVELVRNLYKFQKWYNMENIPEEFQSSRELLVGAFAETVKKIAKMTDFEKRIEDENGDVTPESMLKFLSDFEKERNTEDLYDKLCSFTYDSSQVGDKELKQFTKMLLRAERSDNKANRELAEGLAIYHNIDVLSDGKLDKTKIEELCKKLFPDQTPDAIVEDSELNGITCSRELYDIEQAIYNSEKIGDILSIAKGNEEYSIEILKDRALLGKISKISRARVEENVLATLESLDYSDEKNVRTVVALYCRYREDEKGTQGMPYQAYNCENEETGAFIIRKFMQSHFEIFKKYMKDHEKIDHKAVTRMIEKEVIAFDEMIYIYDKLLKESRTIEENIFDDKEVKDVIDKFIRTNSTEKKDIEESQVAGGTDIGRGKNTDSNSQKLGQDRIDSQNGQSNNVEKADRNIIKSAFSAVARLVTYVPTRIYTAMMSEDKGSRESKREENPSTEIIKVEESKPNGIRKFINKIFGKKENKRLMPGEMAVEQGEQATKANNENDKFKSVYGAKVNEGVAIQQTAEQIAAKNQSEESKNIPDGGR